MNLRNLCTQAAVAVAALSFAMNAESADEARKPDAAGPAAAAPAASAVPAAAKVAETGLAAVYSDRLHGRRTASGQVYDRNKLTAAHKTLPFGTEVRITNVKNQKTVTVRINDRGPTQAGRILDISPRAAKALGIHPLGMGEVTAEVVGEAPAGSKK